LSCLAGGVNRASTTDAFVDERAAAVAQHGAAPVEATAALLDDGTPSARVATPAAHHLAPVSAVRRPAARPARRPRRPEPLVGVAEVRRRLDVDQLRRTRAMRAGRRRRGRAN